MKFIANVTIGVNSRLTVGRIYYGTIVRHNNGFMIVVYDDSKEYRWYDSRLLRPYTDEDAASDADAKAIANDPVLGNKPRLPQF